MVLSQDWRCSIPCFTVATMLAKSAFSRKPHFITFASLSESQHANSSWVTPWCTSDRIRGTLRDGEYLADLCTDTLAFEHSH